MTRSKVESRSPVSETPVDALRRLSGGFAATQMLNAAVQLRLADKLAGGPKSARELAPLLGVHAQSLHRFMRMLTALNLLEQIRDECFALTPWGELLRSDHPEGMAERIAYIAAVSYPTAAHTIHAVTTGRPAFERAFGMTFFEYLEKHANLGELFNKQMGRSLRDRVMGILAAYDFGKVTSVVDVGGGNGTLIEAILAANPRASGVVFDEPKVVAEGRTRLGSSAVAERCKFVAGDFFRDPLPSGMQLYILSNIIHDWDDEPCRRILNNCRSAMPRKGRLLVIEEIIPERVSEAPATVGNDFSMLLLTGGRERTKAELRELHAESQLRVTAIIPFLPSRIYGGRKSNWVIIESGAG